MKIITLRISEVSWQGTEKITSGGTELERRVAIMLNRDLANQSKEMDTIK